MSPFFLFTIGILIILAFSFLGFLTLEALRLKLTRLEFFSVGFPLGAGIFTWALFVGSRFGILINQLTLLIIYVAVAVIAITLQRVLRRNPVLDRGLPSQDRPAIERSLELVLWLLLGIVLLSGFFLAIGRSYVAHDAAAGWALKGYAIGYAGDVLAAGDKGMWGLAYPLNLPMQVTTFFLTTGEILPESKMLYPLYALALILNCILFWIRGGATRWTSIAGGLYILTIPVVYNHSTIGYVNLPFTCLLVTGTVTLLEGIWQSEVRMMWLGGLFFGIATWTRPEGMLYSVAVISTLCFVYWISERKVPPLLPIVLPTLVILSIWLPFSRAAISEINVGTAFPAAVREMMKGTFHKDFLWLEITKFFRRAIDISNWGLFLQVSAILLLIGISTWRKLITRKKIALVTVTITIALIPFFLIYIQSFLLSWDEFEALLLHSFDRAFLPGAAMISLLLLYLIGDNDKVSDVPT